MYPHYSPIDRKGNTNLLPIVYPTLVALGFNQHAIRVVVDDYVEENKIKDLNSVYFTPNDFEVHYMKKLELFKEQATDNPLQSVVRNFLKDKKRSMASASFLGLVRLASAVREGDDERITHALAYYDCIVKELKITGEDIKADNARKGFISLMQKRRHFRGLSLAQTESEKIRIIIQNQDSLLNIVDYEDISQLEGIMLETFTEWYLMTEDEYVLKVILGFHALYVLKDYLLDYELWLKEYWLQAQVFSILTKRSLLWKKVDLLLWDELRAKILNCKDLMMIKLFYAVNDFEKSFKLDNLRRVAQTIVT